MIYLLYDIIPSEYFLILPRWKLIVNLYSVKNTISMDEPILLLRLLHFSKLSIEEGTESMFAQEYEI